MNPLVVVGCAKGVWDDLKWIRTWAHEGHTFEIMLVNDMIIHFREFPGVSVKHVACYDLGRVEHYAAIRRSMCRHEKFQTHSQPEGGAETTWQIDGKFQLTGPFAAGVGIALGYERIILAGIPEDNSGHYWNVGGFRDEPGYDNNGIHEHWGVVPLGRVRSLSGWTREHFHFPAIKWLDGGDINES